MARLGRASADTATGAPRAASYQRSPSLSIVREMRGLIVKVKRAPATGGGRYNYVGTVWGLTGGSNAYSIFCGMSGRWRIGAAQPRKRLGGPTCALLMRV